MYQQNDPYAGQYPPPPPLINNDSYHSIHVSPSSPVYHQQQNYINNTPLPNDYQLAHQHPHYDYNHVQYQPENDDNSLEAYLRRERQEYLAHNQSNAQPNQVTPVESTYQQPYLAKPTPPPINEADAYKPKPVYYEKTNSNCCRSCCCYNPAMTCCSCFCMLFSLAFVAAGIALMVASKIIEEKCSYQCDKHMSQQTCGTICSTVLHDGMFYGGIVVAGLAAISVIWRVIMWTCAGCSQR